ncbi:TetR/AcrR family transcriptional regulator [Micrococcus sp.]|uniref:TetR/AcrR family transcriptional regulator n=1 Tax=Micrococcus sp. TaxID=1271 RepID=UPI002A91CF62|nr:TetR/AcrR family transcriptional regulator [Micrococcus sp.]MDY6054617.1 TetR/AcrR family transcriptional regulator [Micrococcus sp.]
MANTRGATRRARTDERLAEAVSALLREHGYAGLTIERVAAASGTAKTTIYRRWASKAEMVFALVVHRADQAPPIDTGSLVGDVQAIAERAVAVVAGDPGRDVLPGLLADMAGDAGLAARLRDAFVGAARDDIAAILDRAHDRGELSEEADADGFHAALLGIPYAHVHLLANDATGHLSERLAEQLFRLLPLAG